MKTLFFSIATLFVTVVHATDPILVQKNGETRAYATPPKMFGRTSYGNAVIERTEEYNYLFVQSTKDRNETMIFFSEKNSSNWKLIGSVCSSLSEVTYAVINDGWNIEVFGKDCQHLYEKKFTFPGETYVEVK